MAKVKFQIDGHTMYGLSDGKKNRQGELKVLTTSCKLIYVPNAEVV
jgi:hypothetical protein